MPTTGTLTNRVPADKVDGRARLQERLSRIAERYGTPCYLLDLQKLRARIQELRTGLCTGRFKWNVLYSVKTNYLPEVLRAIREAGMGCDCVSGYEIDLALRLGIPPERIVFNGPVKTYEELAFAVERGIFVNIDGVEEISMIARHAQRLGKAARVGIRLNPGRNVYPSADPSFNAAATWKAAHSKFGWHIDDEATDRVIDTILDHRLLRLEGVQCHLGSQITDPSVLADAVSAVVRKAAQIGRRTDLRVVNVGGGFGVLGIQRDREGPLGAYLSFHKQRAFEPLPGPRQFSVVEFVSRVEDALDATKLSHVELACEPGRFLVSDSMSILTRVHSVKRSERYGSWVVVDAGLNILPTAGPSERRVYRMVGDRAQPSMHKFMLGGPLCYEGDVFSFEAQLPSDIVAGELMLIEDAGAYSVSRSTNFIRPRAPVVAIEGDKCELCWRRETYEDIFRFAEPSATSYGDQSWH